MTQHKRMLKEPEDSVALLLRLQGLSDPSIAGYIAKTRAKYGKHVLPADEVRSIVDKSMGNKSLTEVLYRMRESGY